MEATLRDRRAVVADSSYKLGHLASVVSMQEAEKMVDEWMKEKVTKLMEASPRKKYGLPSLEEDVTNSLSTNIQVVVLSPESWVSQIRHITARPIHRSYPHPCHLPTRKWCYEWHSMSCFMERWRAYHGSGSISSFTQLKEKFLEHFAGSIRIKRDPIEFFSMELCKRGTQRQWYEHLTKIVEEIDDITPHEKIAAFQWEVHDKEFLETLIINPQASFANLTVPDFKLGFA